MRKMLDLIGNTPLVYLESISAKTGANIYVKVESRNPGASIKDRAALAYIKGAMERGELFPGGTIVEASSGNLGIGLAHICTQYGLTLILCMPETASKERRILLKGLGAELILTPAEQGMRGALAKAEAVQKEIKGSFFPQQFSNPDGPKAHYESSGPEIYKDAIEQGFKVDVFVAGVGSGATITGIGRYLKEKWKDIFIVAIEPSESAVLSGNPPAPHGIQGIGSGFIPSALDLSILNEILTVSTQDALKYSRRLLKEAGLSAGISSGANLCGAINLANREEFKGKNIVTILCDTGERYLSTALFDEV